MNVALIGSMFGLLVIAVTIVIIGICLKKDFLIPIGVCGCIFIVFFGFVIACTITSNGETGITIASPSEITRSKSLTIVKFEDKVLNTGEHSVYIANDEQIKVKKTQTRNAWGFDINQPQYTVFIEENGNNSK